MEATADSPLFFQTKAFPLISLALPCQHDCHMTQQDFKGISRELSADYFIEFEKSSNSQFVFVICVRVLLSHMYEKVFYLGPHKCGS